MEYEEAMKQVNNIWECLKDADEKTRNAFYYIVDGYEQFNHL